MIGYVTLGTNDIKRAAAFYDALLGEIGAKRSMDFDGFIMWGTKTGSPMSRITASGGPKCYHDCFRTGGIS